MSDGYTCSGQPLGHGICAGYTYKSTCDLYAPPCIWDYDLNACLVFSDCIASDNVYECEQAGPHCGWSNYNGCTVISSETTEEDEWGGCILIQDKSMCQAQPGCSWVLIDDGSDTSIAAFVVLFILLALVGVSVFGVWWFCRKKRRAAAEAAATATAPTTQVVVPASPLPAAPPKTVTNPPQEPTSNPFVTPMTLAMNNATGDVTVDL